MIWGTDLHLDHAPPYSRKDFYKETLDTGKKSLLITGDIAQGDTILRYLNDLACNLPEMVIYFVLGNHDYYFGGLESVRTMVISLCNEVDSLKYLPACPPILLDDHTYLVGIDGWADASFGDFKRTTVWLNDFELISDLKGYSPLGSRSELHKKLKSIANEEAVRLQKNLELVPSSVQRLIIATHVPPFKEAAWHLGKMSELDFLPYFSCKVVGDVIQQYAVDHPEVKVDVYTGHTHGKGVITPCKNLTVYTGCAEYGKPEIQDVRA
jgi:predicted phosphohydrolase